MTVNGPGQNSRGRIRKGPAVLGLVLVLTGMGCGYRFSPGGEGFPQDVRTLYVEPLVNRSRDAGIDREIAFALRSEFHRQGRLRVVDQAEEADAILSGVVRSLESRVVAGNSKDEALQFETALAVDLSLRRRVPEAVLWRAQGMRLTQLYSGSRGAIVTSSSEFKSGTLNPEDLRPFTDAQLTETLRREARVKLVEGLARELHQRLMEMF